MCRDGSILQSKLIRSGFLKRIGKGGLPGKRPSFLLSWLNASCTVLRNKKYKNLFHFPSVFRSVLQIRPTLFDRRRAVVYYYIYFPSRCVLALRPQEISASSLGFVTSALRTPRGTGFSPRRRAMRFPETSFSSIRLYERDVFVAKSLNCSAIFFASGNFVCRCASVGSVVDQKYPHTHGRQRFPCHFSVQLIECIIC